MTVQRREFLSLALATATAIFGAVACHRVRAGAAQMGHELGRFGARSLPGRQSIRAAGSALRVPGSGERRPQPDASHDRAAGCVGPAGAPALLQRVRHQARSRSTASMSGLQLGGPALVTGTNRPVAFAGKPAVTIAPGASVWSDPVDLAFVRDADAAELAGRKLAVSFHVAGESGPMTWHAKALTTSYRRPRPAPAPRARRRTSRLSPIRTASWFFLDAVDMMVPADTRVDRRVRRFHHRRHRIHHERRRPLARRAVAPAAPRVTATRSPW